ncbi:hypothetical protein AB0F81_09300 [Actinoplanes sp. NPDC024001]|uniref:hypothetical protein n=1 Tax=Actinoplanes sp. NPDC024001 TaxID=3154598 RepID=UPI0033FFA81C
MMILVVTGSALLGATTWLALQQRTAADPELNHRLTAVGLVSCLVLAIVTLAVAAVISL